MTVPQADPPGDASHRLEVAHLSKTFGSARVLRNIDLQIAPGELHGLVGQNGCGKSTLVKILSGIYTPDSGASIAVDGRRLALPVQPMDARAAGVAVVHQNLGLVDDRTVWENVRLGRYKAAGRLTRRIDGRAEKEAVEQVLARLGKTHLNVTDKVGGLTSEDRAAVAIARAMQDYHSGSGLIIFDESTRALTKSARSQFFEMVRGVIDSGASVLLISHQLEEIVEVTDRVTVLRDGAVIEAGIATKATDEAGLTRLMLGRHMVVHSRVDSHATSDSAAVVRRLTVRSVKGFDLDLKKGEIVGLTGLVGSGAVAVAEAVGGAREARSGTLTVAGREISLKQRRGSTEDFIAAGVAYVAEARLEQGLAAELSVSDNLTLPRVRSQGGRMRIGGRWQAEETAAMISKLDIRPPDPRKAVGTLSGGNAQKVLLGKWLAGKPELLVLHEPTQAVDVGARQDIITAIRDAAAAGCGVLVASVDAADLAVLCDRVIVFRDGQVTAELTGNLNQDDIIHATFEAPVEQTQKEVAG
ncbi:MAG TPA: sugar ABC transporter ATP-binding protein [Trebonia sp.]|nr:sugar ABC transporter ATP-binding protein [Trebonia sp.]